MNWYMYSALAAILMAGHFLLIKKASLSGLSISLMLMYIWLASGIVMLIYQASKSQLAVPSNTIWIIALATITALAGAILNNIGIYKAPNPGYASAVGCIQVLIVVIFSTIIFGSDFSRIKIVGSILVVAGAILLGI
jgi:uncharacterized membrane protein